MPQHPREQRDLDTSRSRPDAADPMQERSREETLERGGARERSPAGAEEQQQRDADRDSTMRDIEEAPRTGAFPFEKSQ